VQVPERPSDLLGPLPQVGAFQRRRVRRTAAAVAAMAVVCVVVVVADVLAQGVAVAFGPDTPVRVPILAFLAALILWPVVWSAIFRAPQYGITLTDEAIIVRSWWRTRAIARKDVSAARPLLAEMRISDGFFSGQGADAAPFAIWLWPRDPARGPRQIGVSTGSWDVTATGARRINGWLGVDIELREPTPGV